MFCTQCGKEIREGMKFCTNCGTAVKIKAKAATPEAPITPETPEISRTPEIPKTLEIPRIPETPVVAESSGERKTSHIGLIVLIVLLVVLIIAVSFAAFWYLGGKGLILDVIGIYSTEETVGDRDASYIDETKEAGEIEEADEGTQHTSGIESQKSGIDSMVQDAAEDNNAEGAQTWYLDEFDEEEIEEASEYILENSDSQYLTKDDLYGMTADECRLARNELYARHGRKFDDEELQSYFDACGWYQGTIDASDFQESMLNDIEIANRDLIVEYEKEMGYR